MAISYPVLKSTTDSKKDNLIVYNASVKAAFEEVEGDIDDLEEAVGDGVTPVIRTNNPILADNDLSSNVEALDAAIGFDGQLAGTPLDISKNQTVYQNLDALDAKKTVRTIKKTIGNIGVTADFNFVTADDTAEQCIDLGAVLPAKCRLMDILLFTDAAFTNLGALTTDVGQSSGTDGYIAAANNTAINAIMATANAGAFINTPSASAQHVFVNVTPTNKWNSADPVGKMTVYITIIDVTNL